MNKRPLTKIESQNLIELNNFGFESTLVFLTTTMLKKSTIDAIQHLRELLKKNKIHDYLLQRQGESYKIFIDSTYLEDDNVYQLRTSLFRPLAKTGDPRIWFHGFRKLVMPNDILAIFVSKKKVIVLNLTKNNLARDKILFLKSKVLKFLDDHRSGITVATELLDLLKKISSKGVLKSIFKTYQSNSIGYTVEKSLGIKPNPSKKPDFKGIELKSGRSTIFGKQTCRINLFAKVANWSLSTYTSSKEILDDFGYNRGSQFKLYCTVKHGTPNPQGLMLEIEDAKRWLHEVFKKSSKTSPVVIWDMKSLEDELIEKHNETFWIKAKAEIIKGIEHFTLLSVTHTQKPNISQLERMIRENLITVDHLIKRTPSGGAAEKGPFFKIQAKAIPQLFLGVPVSYKF